MFLGISRGELVCSGLSVFSVGSFLRPLSGWFVASCGCVPWIPFRHGSVLSRVTNVLPVVVLAAFQLPARVVATAVRGIGFLPVAQAHATGVQAAPVSPRSASLRRRQILVGHITPAFTPAARVYRLPALGLLGHQVVVRRRRRFNLHYTST